MMLSRRGSRYVKVAVSGGGVACMLARPSYGAGVACMLAHPTWSSSGRSRVLNCTLVSHIQHQTYTTRGEE